MKKIKTFLSASKTNVAVFVLTAALILSATIGAASAAISYVVDTYATRLDMYDIGVSILENGERISWRDYISRGDGEWDEGKGVLLENMLKPGEQISLGKNYNEELSIRNSGTLNEFVRVEVYKYWLDANGEKLQELSPDNIRLNFLCDATGHDNGWLLDKEACTAERTILYYKQLLYAELAEGQEGPSVTEPFADALTIDPQIANKVSETTSKRDGYTNITHTYDYNGVQFRIEVRVTTIQEQNAEEVARSAWGRNVTVSNGMLTLN